jgi:hypothetical protein
MQTLLLESVPFKKYEKAKWQVDANVGTIDLMKHVTFMLMVVNFMEKKGMTTDSVGEGFDTAFETRNGILLIDCNNLTIDSSLFTDVGNKFINKNYKLWHQEYLKNGFVNFSRY